MWLVGVVIRRYIDILIIFINFPYSTCIRSFLAYIYIHTAIKLHRRGRGEGLVNGVAIGRHYLAAELWPGGQRDGEKWWQDLGRMTYQRWPG